MKLTVEDVLRRIESDDFRGDYDGSLKAFLVLERAGYNLAKKGYESCWTCVHFCEEDGCLQKEDDDLLDAFEEFGEQDPNFFGTLFCQHHSVLMIGKCASCGKKINTPRHKHKIWATGIEGSLAACSEQCKEQISWNTIQFYNNE